MWRTCGGGTSSAASWAGRRWTRGARGAGCPGGWTRRPCGPRGRLQCEHTPVVDNLKEKKRGQQGLRPQTGLVIFESWQRPPNLSALTLSKNSFSSFSPLPFHSSGDFVSFTDVSSSEMKNESKRVSHDRSAFSCCVAWAHKPADSSLRQR